MCACACACACVRVKGVTLVWRCVRLFLLPPSSSFILPPLRSSAAFSALASAVRTRATAAHSSSCSPFSTKEVFFFSSESSYSLVRRLFGNCRCRCHHRRQCLGAHACGAFGAGAVAALLDTRRFCLCVGVLLFRLRLLETSPPPPSSSFLCVCNVRRLTSLLSYLIVGKHERGQY